MFPVRDLVAGFVSQHEAIIEVDTYPDEFTEAMDKIYPSETPLEEENPPARYSRGRRWSLDVISPKRFFSRRESTPAVEPDIKSIIHSSSSSVLNGERRHSSPNVKLKGFKFKQSNRFFGHKLDHQLGQLKESYLILHMDSGDNIVITCENDAHANSLLFHAMIDNHVRTHRMIVISSRSIAKVDSQFMGQRSQSCETLLQMKLAGADDDDDDDHDDVDMEIQSSDAKNKIVFDMLDSEKRFLGNLQIFLELHADKLRLVSLLSKGDSLMLVTAIESMISLSAQFITQLNAALGTWDSETTKIGCLFSETVWHFYQDHYHHFLDAIRFLDTHQADIDVQLIDNVELRQGRLSLGNCLTLLVTRIADYGKYLGGLLAETDPSHPDYNDLNAAISNLNSITKEREDDNCDEERRPTMDVLQEGSLYDSNSLEASTKNNNNSAKTPDHNLTNNNNGNDEESTKLSNKPRGLSLRRMSAPSALLFKSLSGNKSKSSSSLWSNNSLNKKDQNLISHFRITEKDSTRMLIMEGSVQFAVGMQIQERYLFLFTDLLLVTKQKSNTAFKLKNRVQLCDVWIASCVEEVAETTRPADQSFVIGWPTHNMVATFPRADIKEYWQAKLREYIDMNKLKDKDTQIQLKIAPRDIESTTQNFCQVSVSNLTEAKDVLLACLNQLNISEHEAKDYQLWVLSGKEGSPYPLIGHETPFSIKLSHVRGLPRSKSGDTIDTMTAADLDSHVDNSSSSSYKCEFYLKKKKSTKKNQFEDSKPVKKNKKSPNIFNSLFRKRRPAQHLIFGLPLSEVCDENLDPPESIIKLMVLVHQQGPQTPGILRRGNKATLSKEIRDKIDSGEKYLLEDHMAPTAASVFKEFLRSIPEGLLVNDLYQHWTTIKKDDSRAEKIIKIKTILSKLPPAHYRLVKLTISLLQHLAKYSSQNHMGPSNLATCIAPSFYPFDATASPQSRLKGESLKQMQMQNSVNDIQNVFVPLISFMIVNHTELFGEDILSMFNKYGCQISPQMNIYEERQELQMQPSLDEDEQEEMVIEEEQEDEVNYSQIPSQRHRLHHRQQHDRMQQDSNSGTDSDSMHSVLSMQDAGMGLRNNDSSTDSLVDREFFTPDADSSPKAVKSHISPSNLSRDSGLTLSDTQLYDEEAFHGEGVSLPTKVYRRSSSHVTENEYNQKHFHQNLGGHLNRQMNPVAPPRKRSLKIRRDSNGSSDTEQYVIIDHRSSFKYGVMTLQQDSNAKSDRSGELRPLLAHPLLSKRVSSDSIGEEDEFDDQLCPVDSDRFRNATDKTVVIKSEGNANLQLSEDSVPTKYQLGLSGSKSKHCLIRQSSVVDNTPPVSPQSRHSQSSRDSVISDSAYSASQDESVHSAPQTPDEPGYKSLNWMPETASKPWNEQVFAHNLNFQHSIPHSKSTSDLLCDADIASNDLLHCAAPAGPLSPKHWPGKFHEAEEIEMRSPQTRQGLRPNSYHSTDLTFHVPPTSPQRDNQVYKKHWFASHFDKGSPPPKVILQTLQTPLRLNSLPERASQDNHKGIPDAESGRFPFESCMSSVRQEDYVNATSRPVIITPPGNTLSTLDSVAARRARLSKYMSSNLNFPSSRKDKESMIPEPKRPDKPPSYHEAVERKLMIKHNVSLDTANSISCESKSKLYESTSSESSDKKKTFRFNSGTPETLSPLVRNSTSSDRTDGSDKLPPLASTNSSSKTVFPATKSQSFTDSILSSKVNNEQFYPAKRNSIHDHAKDAIDHDVQNAMKKSPEKLYQQSVHIYEQNSSVPSSSVATPFVKAHSQQQSNDSAFRSPLKSSPSSPQETNLRRTVTVESVKSKLEVPHFNLYRNHSVSAEHLHDLGRFNSLPTKGRTDAVKHVQKLTKSSSHQSYTDRNQDLKLLSDHRDIKSEIQQNFLRARSYFSQSQDDQHISLAASQSHLPDQSSEPSQGHRLRSWSPKPLKSAVSTEDMTVQSASMAGFKTRMPSKGYHPTTSVLTEHKREIHWSVKDLKSKYDKSNDIVNKASDESSSSNKQSTSGVSQPRSPPPYQNPPPFRSPQKSDNKTGSNKTSSEASYSQRHGPQGFIYDTNGSYSSSDDRSSVRSGVSSNESETISDYTNVTYV